MANFDEENDRENRINKAMAQFYTHIIEAQNCLIEVGDAVIEVPEKADENMLAKVMDALEGMHDLAPVFHKITKHTSLRRELLDAKMREAGVLNDQYFNA